MRRLLALLVIALASAYAPPAAALQVGSDGATAVSSATDIGIAKTTKKKTKSKKKKQKKLTVQLDEIDPVKKGKRGLDITGHISGDKQDNEYTCELKLTYADGTEEETDRVPVDKHDTCTIELDIPNDSEIIGDGEAELIVRNEKGKKKGSDKKVLTVKSGR